MSEKFIPRAKAGGRPRSLDMREVLNAVFYLVVGGISWRMLPNDLPNHKSVYHYLRLWRIQGGWKAIHDRLHAKLRKLSGRKAQPSPPACRYAGAGDDGGRALGLDRTTRWSEDGA